MTLSFGEERDVPGAAESSARARRMERLEAPSFQVDDRMRRHLVALAAEQGVSVQELLESAFGRPREPELAELEEQRRRLYDFLLAEYRANVNPRGTRTDWERWLAEGAPAEEIPSDARSR
ncbi:hypothetical protein ABGB12_31480 [Actinocorallia sp. B10E7]|uniref:hypothetical protein n=1 Tax=Actinocorallia sp. B10E7 TaxID=3153558 RepID=UPI00325F7EC4